MAGKCVFTGASFLNPFWNYVVERVVLQLRNVHCCQLTDFIRLDIGHNIERHLIVCLGHEESGRVCVRDKEESLSRVSSLYY